MVRELTEGIAETEIRAGIIAEIGVNLDYVTAQEERVLRVRPEHSAHWGAGLYACLDVSGRVSPTRILREEAVDPSRVIIGHCDTYLDPAYHREILDTGAYVAFDTIGREHMNPDVRRAESLVRLIGEGWIERLLLSSDRCHRSDLTRVWRGRLRVMSSRVSSSGCSIGRFPG